MELMLASSYDGKKKDDVYIPKPHGAPWRDLWYTLNERHDVRPHMSKDLIGKEVLVNKIITRTGYLFEHTDVDPWDIHDEVELELSKMIKKLFFPHQITEEHMKMALSHFDEIFGNQAKNKAVWRARANWINKVYALPEYKEFKKLRTCWYVDIKDIDPDKQRWVRIYGIKRHQVGVQYDANYYQDYYGEWDGGPGGLTNQKNIGVYLVEGLFGRNYESYWDFRNYGIPAKHRPEVHPLDIMDVREAQNDY